MEKKANYALIGLFTLLVIAAGFGFVLWFEHLGSKKTRIGYRIIFEGPTVGLRVGANVNFNGIRIGEVDSVRIDDPQHVVALVSVERKAPVRKAGTSPNHNGCCKTKTKSSFSTSSSRTASAVQPVEVAAAVVVRPADRRRRSRVSSSVLGRT